jgi:hypothetical protein
MAKRRTATRKVEDFSRIVLLARELDAKVRSIRGNNRIVISIGVIDLEKRDWEHFNPYSINLNQNRTKGLDKQNIRIRELLTKADGGFFSSQP